MGEPASQLNNEPTESNSEPTLIHSPHIEKPNKQVRPFNDHQVLGERPSPQKQQQQQIHTHHVLTIYCGMRRWYMKTLSSIYHWHEAMVHDDIVVDLPVA